MHGGSSGTRKQNIIYFRWDSINITVQSVHYLILWIKIICIKVIFAIENLTKIYLVLLIPAATGIIEHIFLIPLHCFLMLLFLNFLSNSNPIHFVIDMVKRDNSPQSEVRRDFSNELYAQSFENWKNNYCQYAVPSTDHLSEIVETAFHTRCFLKFRKFK